MRPLVFCLLFCSTAHATSAQEYARQLASSATRVAQTTNPNVVPGFQTASPPETAYNDHHALEAATATVHTSNETVAFVQKSAETRPYFRIDMERDPVIENSIESLSTPEKVLEKPLENREEQASYDIVTCQESKPDIEVTCSKNILPPEIHVEPATRDSWWCTLGNHSPCDPHCGARAYTSRAKPEQIHIKHESETSTCRTLEEKTKRGLCKLVVSECPGGPDTREVTGTMGNKTVIRPITRCWRYEMRYVCSYPSPNTCETLRKQGCEQLASVCLTKSGETCVEWKQTYRCPKQKGIAKKRPICRAQSPIYGKIEAATPISESSNTDLNEVVSKLQVLREVQDEFRASGNSQNLPPLFKGNRGACTMAFAGFKNCCTDGSGWGVSLGLSGCGKEDTDLAERKQKGLCREIGEYCAEKVLGVCIRKKRVSCCFPSKLARLLHEQGRAQLGIDWRDAENPNCRGFTTDELARINFDRLDLREIFAEVAARMRSTTTEVVKRNLSDRVGQMTHNLRNSSSGRGM